MYWSSYNVGDFIAPARPDLTLASYKYRTKNVQLSLYSSEYNLTRICTENSLSVRFQYMCKLGHLFLYFSMIQQFSYSIYKTLGLINKAAP